MLIGLAILDRPRAAEPDTDPHEMTATIAECRGIEALFPK
jgi:hypothetical protein